MSSVNAWFAVQDSLSATASQSFAGAGSALETISRDRTSNDDYGFAGHSATSFEELTLSAGYSYSATVSSALGTSTASFSHYEPL